MKYDDTDWHTIDNAKRNEACVHIALYFVWLVNKRYVKDKDIKDWGISLPLDETKSPSWYLSKLSDDKLLSIYMKPEAIAFTDENYETYLDDIADPDKIKVERDPFPAPYNIKDSWENALVVASYLDDK
jgi:hypothetical protein